MSTDFLTDLDTIGHLDWAAPCSTEGCDRTPDWYVRVDGQCRCCTDGLLCEPHRKELIAELDRMNSEHDTFFCGDCNVLCVVTADKPWAWIDRIVPLRGPHDRP